MRVAVAGAVVTIAMLHTPLSASSEDDIRREVLAINRALVEAQNACDVERFDRLTADRFNYVTSVGKRMTRAELLGVERQCAHRGSSIDQEIVVVLSDNVAEVIGHWLVGAISGRPGKHITYSRIFVKQNGAWKQVSHHNSAIENNIK